MGSPLQQILSGGRGEERQGLWLKAVLISLIVSAWAFLLLDFPLPFPYIWFPSTVAVIAFCGVMHMRSQRQDYAIEFLFSSILLYAGIVDTTGLPWLNLAYFPFFTALSRFYPVSVILPLSILVPFIELKAFVVTFPVVPEVENDAVAQCVRMLEALRTEMINSQSARMPSRLQPFDSTRFTSLVDRLESFMVDYIGKALPLDLPESSPQEGMTVPSHGGV